MPDSSVENLDFNDPYRPETIFASSGARAGSDIRAFRRAGIALTCAGTAL
jgi:hypothetical protein